MNNFQIIPILSFVILGIIIIPTIYQHYTVTIPDAKKELKALNDMSCNDIRKMVNHSTVTENRKFIRDQIDICKELDTIYHTKLTNIHKLGTEKEKINAGFTFDLYEGWQHPDKRFALDTKLLKEKRNKMITPIIIKIPENVKYDHSINLKQVTLVKHVNNTIIFQNNDNEEHWYNDDYGRWHVGIMKPGESSNPITIDVGNYTYSDYPNYQGSITVLPSPYEN